MVTTTVAVVPVREGGPENEVRDSVVLGTTIRRAEDYTEVDFVYT